MQWKYSMLYIFGFSYMDKNVPHEFNEMKKN